MTTMRPGRCPRPSPPLPPLLALLLLIASSPSSRAIPNSGGSRISSIAEFGVVREERTEERLETRLGPPSPSPSAHARARARALRRALDARGGDGRAVREVDKVEEEGGGGGVEVEVEVAFGGGAGGGGTATVPSEVLNLVKSIVGAGVLSLPAGIAAFGDAPTAVVPAALLIAILGAISGYTFSLIGRVCSYTGASTYTDAWERTVGRSTSFLPGVSATLSCLTANLAYSMILADAFGDLLGGVGARLSRSTVLFGVTVSVLLPLCLLKDLSSLAPFSLLGIAGMAYTSVAMAASYLSGNYRLPDGKFLPDVAEGMRPSFGTTGASGALSAECMILVCTLSTAYMAHFNAPKFYVELRDNTMDRFNAVVRASFGISVAIFCAVASVGFLTFGRNCSGLILNNYSARDGMMGLSRVAVAVSIVFSYPLIFVGSRDGLLDLLSIPQPKRTAPALNYLTAAILAALTVLALNVRDLSLVLSLAGATLGNALIYVWPALMFRGAVRGMGEGATDRLRAEVATSTGAAVLGAAMGCLGAGMALGSRSA